MKKMMFVLVVAAMLMGCGKEEEVKETRDYNPNGEVLYEEILYEDVLEEKYNFENVTTWENVPTQEWPD